MMTQSWPVHCLDESVELSDADLKQTPLSGMTRYCSTAHWQCGRKDGEAIISSITKGAAVRGPCRFGMAASDFNEDTMPATPPKNCHNMSG
eukprot:3409402-Amphidinium_carterae.1